jgi:hypothetical protein
MSSWIVAPVLRKRCTSHNSSTRHHAGLDYEHGAANKYRACRAPHVRIVSQSPIGLTDEPELALPLSQLLLADSLGMTPVHLNRVLKELRVSGATILKRGSLLVADPGKLVQIAGFDETTFIDD